MTYDIIVIEEMDKTTADKIDEFLHNAHSCKYIKDYSWRKVTPNINVEDFISGLNTGIVMANLYPKIKT